MIRITHSVRWKPISRFSNFFISNTGVVRFGTTIITPKVCKTNGGYLYVTMRGKELFASMYIHEMVWFSFSDVPKKRGWEIHHKDKDILNNNFDNLDYLPKEKHLKEHGRKPNKSLIKSNIDAK